MERLAEERVKLRLTIDTNKSTLAELELNLEQQKLELDDEPGDAELAELL